MKKLRTKILQKLYSFLCWILQTDLTPVHLKPGFASVILKKETELRTINAKMIIPFAEHQKKT